MSPRPTRWGATRIALALAGAALLCVGALLMHALLGGGDLRALPPTGGAAATPASADAALVQRGAYLARVGNCAGCHTAPGGAPYAGGQAIDTPFGTVYGSNLTPDPQTGLGRWTADAFWRALHEGRSADGRLLYPAFPYTNTTHVRREDSDALFAYLRSLPPVSQANREHDLSLMARSPLALAAWRLLYFRPASPQDAAPAAPPQLSAAADLAEWQRGAYLVRGLAHCSACHAQRNALGAAPADALQMDGGLMTAQGWYAPSLHAAGEGAVRDWPVDEVVALLTVGTTSRGAVQGPMAEVVHGSTSHLSPADARAMARFLTTLPERAPPPRRDVDDDEARNLDAQRSVGKGLYFDHCADCHGEAGEGTPGAYPPLAGNRAVLMNPPVNLVQMLVHGGYAPSTPGNPRPYGMPPYALEFSQNDMAAVLTYVRTSWGNQGKPVSPLAVQRWRGQRP